MKFILIHLILFGFYTSSIGQRTYNRDQISTEDIVLIKDGKEITLNYSKEMVIKAWGKPDKIEEFGKEIEIEMESDDKYVFTYQNSHLTFNGFYNNISSFKIEDDNIALQIKESDFRARQLLRTNQKLDVLKSTFPKSYQGEIHGSILNRSLTTLHAIDAYRPNHEDGEAPYTVSFEIGYANTIKSIGYGRNY